jgi:hypothetical protein
MDGQIQQNFLGIDWLGDFLRLRVRVSLRRMKKILLCDCELPPELWGKGSTPERRQRNDVWGNWNHTQGELKMCAFY